jgi:hypothetical protein
MMYVLFSFFVLSSLLLNVYYKLTDSLCYAKTKTDNSRL